MFCTPVTPAVFLTLFYLIICADHDGTQQVQLV